MQDEKRLASILLADCGTVATKAVLLEQVAGQYRLVARGEALTTAEPPWSDLAAGIRHAVEQIAEATGRQFFDANGDLLAPERQPSQRAPSQRAPSQRAPSQRAPSAGQQGVDAFAATVSASQPLQTVLVGLVRDLSVASLERAASGTYSLVKAILAGDGQTGGSSDEERARIIHTATPDVICVAGGVEGGAAAPVLELVDTASLACSLMPPGSRPSLLYAGNSRLRQQVVRIVDSWMGKAEREFVVRVADNVRPTMAEENLAGAQAELDALYVQEKMGLLPGVETVNGWSSVPLTPTARAFGRLMQYLWHLGNPSRGVLGVDVGAASTTIAAVLGGQLYLTIRADLGTAFGGAQLLQKHPRADLTRWLPDPRSVDELRAALLHKESHPASIPQEAHTLWLEQALAREAIRATLERARPGWKPGIAQPYAHLMPLCDTIVVGGSALTHAPRPGQVALIVLDGLEPVGISTLVLDRYQVASALGNVAAVEPLAAVEALDSGALVNLGCVVAPVGRARRGDIILNVQVTHSNGSTLSAEIRYGDLEVLPLPPGQQAVIELRPLRNFDVGLGGPGKGGKRRVTGGLAGLIIDARGRPLPLSGDPGERQSQVRQWLWDVGG